MLPRLQRQPRNRQKRTRKTLRKLSKLPKQASAKLQNLCLSSRSVRNNQVEV